jgi:Domain of unknown function (DUF397)
MGSGNLVFRWRKSSHSGGSGQCVEVGLPDRARRKGGRVGPCVMLTLTGAIRDSKNSTGPVIRGDTRSLVGAVKAGKLDH